MALLASMTATAIAALSSLLGNLTLFCILLLFLLAGAWKKVPVYEAFVEGAKEGFDIAKNLLPYLVAMLCAVGMLRASGALDFLLDGIRWLAAQAGWDARFVDALPTALVKPFSGSAARALMLETMTHFGVDSFPALLATVVRQHRDHLLRAGGVLRLGGHPARAPRRGLRAGGRRRRAGRDRRVLLVLRLNAAPSSRRRRCRARQGPALHGRA